MSGVILTLSQSDWDDLIRLVDKTKGDKLVVSKAVLNRLLADHSKLIGTRPGEIDWIKTLVGA